MAKILIIRFSAIGDVAMTIPVITSFANEYPQHEITILSKDNFACFFEYMPSNVTFKGVDLKSEYKGIPGLNRIYNQLKEEKFNAVIDLHDTLRSKYLRLRFKIDGIKCAHINKERAKRKELTKFKNKILKPSKSSFEKYSAVFNELGYPFNLNFKSIFGNEKGDLNKIPLLLKNKNGNKWIGIAPFAAHLGKIYPIEKQEEVIKMLSQNSNYRIFLFGGGKKEIETCQKWESISENIISLAGKLKFNQELIIMSHLDVMISMDSANMHLASLVNTKVISIWGSTHPFAGFMGWNQSTDNAIQTDLPCRPCSIYGNKPCMRKDYACLNNITPKEIVDKVISLMI